MQYSQAQLKEKYNKWYNGLQDVYARWDKIGLLEGLTDDYHARMVALALENQKLINDHNAGSITVDESHGWFGQFLRISIPLVRRVFGNAPFTEWVGLQTKLGPEDVLWLDGEHGISERAMAATTKKFKALLPLHTEKEKKEYHTVMDLEADKTMRLSLDIADEISREVITDLTAKCTKKGYSVEEGQEQIHVILTSILLGCQGFKSKLGHPANWIITSSEMLEEFKSQEKYNFVSIKKPFNHGDVFKAGTITVYDGHVLSVFVEPLFTRNKMLLGHKGDWRHVGYYYMPYIPFSATSVILNPESFNPQIGLITRFAKYLKREGHNYYELVEIKNFMSPEERNQGKEIGPLGPGTMIVLHKVEDTPILTDFLSSDTISPSVVKQEDVEYSESVEVTE